MSKIRIFCFSLLIAIVNYSFAGAIDDANEKYDAGEYALAFTLFKELADEDPYAQYSVGYMYANGEGVEENKKEAMKWYIKAADQGQVRAQYKLGVRYASGQGVIESDLEAVKWFTKAAEQGDADAQSSLGWMYHNGEGVLENVTTAVKWYTLAAEQGDAGAQYNLGVMYANGQGVIESDLEAVKWFTLAAEQGDAGAQYNLGVMYANGQGVIESNLEAVKWFTKAAEQGDAVAQYNLGVMYANGQGVIESDLEAVKWFTKAAEQGDAVAQYNLGVMYANGQGVIESDLEAVKWYTLAAEQGDADAQSSLGSMYFNGEGVLENVTTAVKWYTLAAEQGDADAQSSLGWMYDNGEGVLENVTTAVKWYTLAAEQGDAGAQYNLGVMYANGQGVIESDLEAVKWFTLAAEQGDADAQSSLGWMYDNGEGVLELESSLSDESTSIFQLISMAGKNSDPDFLKAVIAARDVSVEHPQASDKFPLIINCSSASCTATTDAQIQMIITFEGGSANANRIGAVSERVRIKSGSNTIANPSYNSLQRKLDSLARSINQKRQQEANRQANVRNTYDTNCTTYGTNINCTTNQNQGNAFYNAGAAGGALMGKGINALFGLKTEEDQYREISNKLLRTSPTIQKQAYSWQNVEIPEYEVTKTAKGTIHIFDVKNKEYQSVPVSLSSSEKWLVPNSESVFSLPLKPDVKKRLLSSNLISLKVREYLTLDVISNVTSALSNGMLKSHEYIEPSSVILREQLKRDSMAKAVTMQPEVEGQVTTPSAVASPDAGYYELLGNDEFIGWAKSDPILNRLLQGFVAGDQTAVKVLSKKWLEKK